MLRSLGFPVLTLGIGGVGGGLAGGLGLSGGWLFGALLAVASASALGAPLALPGWARSVALGFAGLVVGAAIHRETLSAAASLPWSIAAMAALLVLVVAVSYWLHRRRWGASPPTALACAWPGNLMLALASAESLKADMERVAVVQLARLVALVVVLPLLVGGDGAKAPASSWPGGGFLVAMAVTLPCILLARRWTLPGGEMFLAAIAVGALVATEAVTVAVPDPINSFFQIVVGSFVGLSLARCRLGSLRSAVAPALLGALVAAALTLGAALSMSWITGQPAVALALAYAPGGAEAMILLATAFGVDPGQVGIHHTLRLIALTLLFPLVARLLVRPRYQATGSR